jgi:hypothetical protein
MQERGRDQARHCDSRQSDRAPGIWRAIGCRTRTIKKHNIMGSLVCALRTWECTQKVQEGSGMEGKQAAQHQHAAATCYRGMGVPCVRHRNNALDGSGRLRKPETHAETRRAQKAQPTINFFSIAWRKQHSSQDQVGVKTQTSHYGVLVVGGKAPAYTTHGSS